MEDNCDGFQVATEFRQTCEQMVSMITCRKATFADDIQLGGGFKDFLF